MVSGKAHAAGEQVHSVQVYGSNTRVGVGDHALFRGPLGAVRHLVRGADSEHGDLVEGGVGRGDAVHGASSPAAPPVVDEAAGATFAGALGRAAAFAGGRGGAAALVRVVWAWLAVTRGAEGQQDKPQEKLNHETEATHRYPAHRNFTETPAPKNPETTDGRHPAFCDGSPFGPTPMMSRP